MGPLRPPNGLLPAQYSHQQLHQFWDVRIGLP